MILLDTNVISEVYRPRPDARLRLWLDRQNAEDLFLCSPVLGELRFGVERLEESRRRDFLEGVVSRIEVTFADRILPFDQQAARTYGRVLAHRYRIGRPMMTMDAEIAAIALSRQMSLATRDVAGFTETGLDLINPFEAVGR